ncbi:MAG: serine/threonine protein kinase [Polyangiaceae bacterium]
MAESLRSGRFVIVGVLGEGGQGRTFDAVDEQVGQPVAVKRFDVRGARAWKDVDLAERETRVLQSLSHPSLPRYVDHFEQDGVLYLVTEKIEGASLAVLQRQGAPFGEEDAMRLLGDAAKVLAYLHGRSPPVVHRDLKPANVIRRPDGSYAFVDFGAVRDNLRPEGGSTVVGTFGYMAPEQFQGRALPGSDVYGVGATVLSLLAGTEPEALPHRGLAIDVRAALKGRASERLTRILERMLEPDPDRRAQAIAPLLAERGGPGSRGRAEPRGDRREQGRAPWEDWRQEAHDQARHFQREAHDQARRYQREAHDQARRARNDARAQAREWRRNRRSWGGPPWPIEVIFTLVFAVGLVAVTVVTQVALPLLLRVLSVLLARRQLRDAADAVQEAGGRAVRSIAQSRRWMRGEPPPPAPRSSEAPRARVAPGSVPQGARAPEGPGIRVAPEHHDDDEELDEEDGHPEDRAGRAGRRKG